MFDEQRLPDLSDKELDTLHANALRLVQSDNVSRRAQAEHLLPLIDAARQERRSAKAALLQEKRAQAPAPKRKAAKKGAA